jgi:DNA-binding transcriptional LysR family regulator
MQPALGDDHSWIAGTGCWNFWIAAQIGLVEAGLGIAVIPFFGVLASRDRKVRITELDPVVTLEFQEISNRGRKLSPEASEFGAFLKEYIARRVSER